MRWRLRDSTELSGVTECSVSTEVVGMWVYTFVKTLQNVHLKNKCILPYINYNFINLIFFMEGMEISKMLKVGGKNMDDDSFFPSTFPYLKKVLFP